MGLTLVLQAPDPGSISMRTHHCLSEVCWEDLSNNTGQGAQESALQVRAALGNPLLFCFHLPCPHPMSLSQLSPGTLTARRPKQGIPHACSVFSCDTTVTHSAKAVGKNEGRTLCARNSLRRIISEAGQRRQADPPVQLSLTREVLSPCPLF